MNAKALGIVVHEEDRTRGNETRKRNPESKAQEEET